ncbi:hypothetical protein REPUB_Repub01dG0050300 [Reevesia pubescens]
MSAIAGSYGYIAPDRLQRDASGSHKHVNRRGAVADGSSAVSDGKPGKRANPSGYGSHEELVSIKLKYHYGGGSESDGDFGGDGLMVRFVDDGTKSVVDLLKAFIMTILLIMGLMVMKLCVIDNIMNLTLIRNLIQGYSAGFNVKLCLQSNLKFNDLDETEEKQRDLCLLVIQFIPGCKLAATPVSFPQETLADQRTAPWSIACHLQAVGVQISPCPPMVILPSL